MHAIFEFLIFFFFLSQGVAVFDESFDVGRGNVGTAHLSSRGWAERRLAR